MNNDRTTTTDKLRARVRQLRLAARVKEVEHKATLSKEYQRGIAAAREVVEDLEYREDDPAAVAAFNYVLRVIDALTMGATDTEGGE